MKDALELYEIATKAIIKKLGIKNEAGVVDMYKTEFKLGDGMIGWNIEDGEPTAGVMVDRTARVGEKLIAVGPAAVDGFTSVFLFSLDKEVKGD